MNPTSLGPSFASPRWSSSTRETEAGAAPALAAYGRELRPYLAAVPDPRGRQGRRYPLLELLLRCLLGFSTGCQGYLSVARWARARSPAVRRELGFTRERTPCAATWLTLFRVLDWEVVATQFQAWAEANDLPPADTPPAPALQETGVAPVGCEPAWQGLTLDGKTLRGSLATGAATAHVVSVVAHGSGLSLREVGVREKEGELTVAPDLLAAVLGPGRVITGDALFTQRALCQQICAGQSHFVLIVKENQPTLRHAVHTVLGPVTRAEARAQHRRSVSRSHTGHGRQEQRCLLLAAVTADQVDWPGLRQVFCLERRRYQPARAGKPAQESRELVYGITSLAMDEAGPEMVLRLQRGHWTIANRMHWVLDTFFREDERRIRDGQVARGVAALRRGALNLLRRLGGRSIPEAADRVKANPALLLPLLGTLQEN